MNEHLYMVHKKLPHKTLLVLSATLAVSLTAKLKRAAQVARSQTDAGQM